MQLYLQQQTFLLVQDCLLQQQTLFFWDIGVAVFLLATATTVLLKSCSSGSSKFFSQCRSSYTRCCILFLFDVELVAAVAADVQDQLNQKSHTFLQYNCSCVFIGRSRILFHSLLFARDFFLFAGALIQRTSIFFWENMSMFLSYLLLILFYKVNFLLIFCYFIPFSRQKMPQTPCN